MGFSERIDIILNRTELNVGVPWPIIAVKSAAGRPVSAHHTRPRLPPFEIDLARGETETLHLHSLVFGANELRCIAVWLVHLHKLKNTSDN